MDIENLQKGGMGVADILRLGLSITSTGKVIYFYKFQHIPLNYLEIWSQYIVKKQV